MKKTTFTILGILLLSLFSLGLFVRANGQSASLSLPTATQIANLKSTANGNKLTANGNKLTAAMWNQMLDYLTKINSQLNTFPTLLNNKLSTPLQLFQKCAGRTDNNEDIWKSSTCEPKRFGMFLNDGAYPIREPYSKEKIARQNSTINLGKKQFCALNAVAFKNVDSTNERAENICYVFKYGENRYLYANEMKGKVYCEATCF